VNRAHRAAPALRLTRTAALCLLLAACATVSRRPPPVAPPSPPPAPPPGGVESVPDAVPRAEPRSAHGNPPFYGVLGRRYFVLATASSTSPTPRPRSSTWSGTARRWSKCGR